MTCRVCHRQHCFNIYNLLCELFDCHFIVVLSPLYSVFHSPIGVFFTTVQGEIFSGYGFASSYLGSCVLPNISSYSTVVPMNLVLSVPVSYYFNCPEGGNRTSSQHKCSIYFYSIPNILVAPSCFASFFLYILGALPVCFCKQQRHKYSGDNHTYSAPA